MIDGVASDALAVVDGIGKSRTTEDTAWEIVLETASSIFCRFDTSSPSVDGGAERFSPPPPSDAVNEVAVAAPVGVFSALPSIAMCV